MINFLGFQLNGWFLAAGVACACVPFIIHLLNRRRYRIVQWAAMDFLRQALQRNRRIMQIRDLLLLALRTLAVLLFGLALAQPLWQKRSQEEFDPNDRKPLHAVMIVDNSLSMGYEPADQVTLLDRAKDRAKEFIDELPQGSRVTVVPLCGAHGSFSMDPYRTTNEATGAVDQIEVVHRGTNIDQAADVARRASDTEGDLAKRVVFLSDQQRGNWQGRLHAEGLKQYPEMQVVDVSSGGASDDGPENSWISEFRMHDDIADTQTQAIFTVRLRHSGATKREDVRLALSVNGEEIQPRHVDLEPGTAETEVVFKHQFADENVEAGTINYVPVKVTLSADEHDRLLSDNERFLVVPVVAALPVVFVDELGEANENRALNRYGETWQLRRWLVPIVDRNNLTRQLVRIKHATIDELDEELLSDARLVVIAGVEDPASSVDLLREYVQQGGQLMIAAGGEFDPRAWDAAAWRGGQGILPAPLGDDLIGQIPGVDGAGYEWFELKYDGMLKNHGLFKLSEESDADLAALYSEPFFFQAVEVGDVNAIAADLIEEETERLKEQFAALAAANARIERYNKLEETQELSDEQRAERAADQLLLADLQPHWLTWALPEIENDVETNESAGGVSGELAGLNDDADAIEQLAQATAIQQRPLVLAQFDNGHPFLVQRRIGRGQVFFVASGIKPEWNTLSRTDAVLLYDRILRGMLNTTLPSRTFITQENIALPIEGNTSNLEFELIRPAHNDQPVEPEPLTVGFIGAQTRGLTIHNALHQGVYQITAYKSLTSADAQDGRNEVWRTAVAVNVNQEDDGGESELAPLTRKDFEDRLAGEEVPLTWVAAGETISLAGASVRGQNWWKFLAVVVLVLLLLEISILAWPAVNAAAPNGNGAEQGATP